MMWFFIAVLALMIPLVAVVLDSQLGRAIAARLERESATGDTQLDRRIAALESEVEELGRQVERLEEESRFMQRLLEGGGGSSGPDALPSGGAGRE